MYNNGHEFEKRTIEQTIKYNAICWGYDPDKAWADYLKRYPEVSK